MIKFLEPVFFGSVAVASHVALFVSAPVGLPPASGDDGRALITLAAAPQGMDSMVTRWTTPPVAATEVVMTAPPAPMAEPPAPSATQAPRPPMPAPKMAVPELAPTAPAIDMAPAARPEPRPKAKPKPAPKQAAKTAKPSAKGSAPRAAQKAAGAGNKGNAGKNGKAKTATKQAASSPKALSQWHASIRNKVERNKRTPRNCRTSGTATLRMKIGTSGQLLGLSLAKSSGHAALDKAALSAAKGARLPKAPKGVTGATAVNLPIRFQC